MSIVIKGNVIGECARFNQSKKLQSKNVLIDEKSYKDLVIFFFGYDRGKSKRMSWKYENQYHELIGKIEEHKGKNIWWLMIIC